MEENLVQSTPIEEAQFEEQIHSVAENNLGAMIENFMQNGTLFLRNYNCVSKFKSVRRAIKKGYCSIYGDIYPRRPFNNRKRNKKGDITNQRRKVYKHMKEYGQGGL
jgi:hypothetical protein